MTARELVVGWLRDTAEELKELSDRLERGENLDTILGEASKIANDTIKMVVEERNRTG